MYFLLFLLVLSLCKAQENNTIVVETTNGFILGRINRTETSQKTKYFAFQGIPYAEPPVGNLRFNDPVWVKNWTGTYNATYERNVCTQSGNNKINGTENCLFLNIYTPKINNTNDNSGLATIVWIHGGGYATGSGNIGLHGADYFIDHEIIFVSINYRLSVFGFLSTEDAASPGNWGIKDQILALKWINKNIDKFGGDPKNITIMGESAGASSVHFLIESDNAKGLFKAAIAESGSSLDPWSISSNARKIAFQVGIVNLIITNNSTYLIERLRKLNYKQLIKSTTLPTLLELCDPLNGLPFAPIYEKPSAKAAVIKFSYEALLYGQFSKVPLLHGFNSLEARVAKDLPWYGYIILAVLLTQYNVDTSRLTPKDMNATTDGKKIVGEKIKSFYFHNKTITDGVNLINFISDNEFVRGIVQNAGFHSLYAPCYLYNFSFIGGVQHENFTPEGVAHAEELQFLFSAPEYKQKTPEAILTSKRMVEMWSNFAKYNNPTPKKTEIINVTWPLVNATGYQNYHYLDINTQLIPKINPRKQQINFWHELYYNYGNPPFTTY